MLQPNGEDYDKLLTGRTKPPSEWAGLSQFAEVARQPEHLKREVTSPIRPLAETALGARYIHHLQWGAEPALQYLTNFAAQGLRPKATPFKPDRITGPIQFILNLLESWNLTAVDAVALLGFEQVDKTNVEAILAGRLSLRGRDVKDRITALFRIKSLVAELFREDEMNWMATPRAEFANRSPLDMLREGSMVNLLTVRQYVEHISGL